MKIINKLFLKLLGGLVIIFLVNQAQVTIARAQVNYFSALETLVIGQVLPTDLRDLGEIIDKNEPTTIAYLFESDDYSQPHFLKTNFNHLLVWLELKIPRDKMTEYQGFMSSLGEPELKKSISHTQSLLSYPTQGVGFITDSQETETGLPVIIKMLRFPPQTVAEFAEEKGQKFTEPSLEESLAGLSELEEKSVSKFSTEQLWRWGLIGVFVLSLLGFSLIIAKFLKANKTQAPEV